TNVVHVYINICLLIPRVLCFNICNLIQGPHDALDETKKNVRKSINEARNQIPQYTDVVKNYQEQALESTGKIVEDYVEAQKSIIPFLAQQMYIMKMPLGCITIGFHQKYQQSYGPDQLATSQEIFQHQQELVMISYLEILMLWDAHSNELNSIQKSFQELM
ncbi:MAG: hypothetical protein WBL68_13895, partial [Nitrososphaeraceae archaeon]